MADHEQKAIEMMAQADKKLKSAGGLFGSFFGGSSKTDEAAELYVKAGNAFKMAKKWAAAGGAFCRAASVQLKAGSKHEAATQYIDAGTCYKKSDPAEAVNCLLKAIEIYTDMGRFTIAAKHHMTIAEIYETDMVDVEKCISNYEQAADYYKGEESNSAANKCLLKVAQYASQLEQYDKAITIYEQVAAGAITSALLRYSAKDHYFRAALCRMCVDTQDASTSVARYEEAFPSFADSRECKLVKTLIGAVEEQNTDAFTEAVRSYDSISRLEQWYTTILLRIKKSIEGEGSLR